jgi:hypothetical protein
MESLGSSAYLPLLVAAGLGIVLLLVMVFVFKSTFKMAKAYLVLGILGIFVLCAAALAVLWALAR